MQGRASNAEFRELGAPLRQTVLSIKSKADLDAALEALDNAEDQFSEDADGHGRFVIAIRRLCQRGSRRGCQPA